LTSLLADHIEQYIYRDGIHYIGSGVGGQVSQGHLNDQTEGLQWYLTHHLGFVSIGITKSQSVFEMNALSTDYSTISMVHSITISRQNHLTGNEEDQSLINQIQLKLRNRLLDDW
jgi:hypothetical protein